MSDRAIQRRLAAIFAADVVGYSTLMAKDEAGTLTALKEHRRALFDPAIAEHGGRIVKLMGDGALVEFASVVSAVDCALVIQQALSAENGSIRLRIGVNLGDVIIDGDDIYGDGVNVAARLEALAPPGGISISGLVHESLGNRVDANFVDAGEHQVKNIARPIRIWRWAPDQRPGATAPAASPGALPLPEKPSIAVLPFANMSADPDQSFFADGISEDLITEMSKFHSLFVISRSSAFAYRDRSVPVKEIGARLGVRYVVEGSVRRAGSRLRITAQLIDALEDTHLWAERYDRQVEDIFAVQDEVVRAIVSAIEPQLLHNERSRALRKPTHSLNAWESYQRGLWHTYSYDPAERQNALTCFERAIALDPGFASAHAGLSIALYIFVIVGASPDMAADRRRALDEARIAVSLDSHDPLAFAALSSSQSQLSQHEAAILAADQAIALSPSMAFAHFRRGHALWHAGRPQEAILSIDEALRLSPQDRMSWAFLASKAIALLLSGNLEAAIEVSRQAQKQPNDIIFAHIAEISALGLLGRQAEAAEALTRARAVKSDVSISYLDTVLPITQEASRKVLLTGLRRAGMPD